MHHYLIGLVALLLCGAAARADGLSDIGRLAWLEGLWVGVQDGVESEERWTPVKGGMMLGLHRDVRGDRVLFWEFLRIAADAEGIHYHAQPRSAPPVSFRLVRLGAREVSFENPAHDFPQRIDYWLDGDGRLNAKVSGHIDGQLRSESWRWRRASP